MEQRVDEIAQKLMEIDEYLEVLRGSRGTGGPVAILKRLPENSYTVLS